MVVRTLSCTFGADCFGSQSTYLFYSSVITAPDQTKMGELRVSTWCKTRQKSIRAMMILSENSTRLPERESSVHDIHLAPTRRRHNRQAAIRKSRSKGNRARHNRTLETLGSGRALPRERIENRKYRQRKTSSSAAKSGKRKATGPEGGEGTKRTSKNASAGSSDDGKNTRK